MPPPQPKVFNWKEIVPDRDLIYEAPRKNVYGLSQVPVRAIDKETGRSHPLLFQCPAMRLPFGFENRSRENERDLKANFSFTSVLKDPSTGQYTGQPEMMEFFNWVKSLEECNKMKAASECGRSWFQKEHTKEVIDALYTSSIVEATPMNMGKYSPTLRVNVMSSTAFFNRYDDKSIEPIKLQDLDRGRYRANVVPMIETSGIYFSGNQFGMSFRLTQIVIFERTRFVGLGIDLSKHADHLEEKSEGGNEYDNEGPALKRQRTGSSD